LLKHFSRPERDHEKHFRLVLPSYFCSQAASIFLSQVNKVMPVKMELRYNAPLFAAA
jgi:hypothetical protein